MKEGTGQRQRMEKSFGGRQNEKKTNKKVKKEINI